MGLCSSAPIRNINEYKYFPTQHSIDPSPAGNDKYTSRVVAASGTFKPNDIRKGIWPNDRASRSGTRTGRVTISTHLLEQRTCGSLA